MVDIELLKSRIDKFLDSEELTSETSPHKGINKSKILILDGKKFLWKSVSGDHTSKWRAVPPKTQYLRERAAYLISEALGWGLVPHTIIFTYKNEIGSRQDWVIAEKSDKTLNSYSLENIWKAGILDIALGSLDRHSGNFLTKGNKPILLDNGYSLPVSASGGPRDIILSRFAFRIWGKKIPLKIIEDIKKLNNKNLLDQIKDLVGQEAYKLFILRVNELLSTGIAKVNKYTPREIVKGIPPEQ